MLYNEYLNIINNYISEFQNDPNNIEEYKIKLLKDHFYFYVEKYIDVKREDFLIGVTKNKNYLYFQSKLNPNLHFVTNLNKEDCNYLKFDYPVIFVEKLNTDEIHYKKYKTQIMNFNKEYKNNCYCLIN